jgi:hypothetical protein
MIHASILWTSHSNFCSGKQHRKVHANEIMVTELALANMDKKCHSNCSVILVGKKSLLKVLHLLSIQYSLAFMRQRY